MSATFDPYHKWLGILPKDQPPHHYRLLGLEPFEDDLQVIEAAADRQLGFLRKFQSGEHAADCQKLLNEVSRARLCLLKPAPKQAYDSALREQLTGPVAEAIAFDPVLATSRAVLKSPGPGVVAWASVAVLLLLVVGGLTYLFSGKARVDRPLQPAVADTNPEERPSEPEPDKAANSPDSGTKPEVAQPEPKADSNGQISILPLLKSVNIVAGSWSIKPDRLESLAHNLRAQVALPVSVPAEYTLHVAGTRLEHPNAPTNTCVIGLVCGNHHCIFGTEVDPRHGISGLEMLDGRSWKENSTTLPGFHTTVGKPFQLDAIVRKEGIEVRIDGRTIVDWHGSFDRLKRSPGYWDQSDPKQLFVGAESKYVFTKVTLGPPLPPRKLPGADLKVGESVELLKLVDFQRDVWNGDWLQEGLTMKSSANSGTARFTVPYQVPEEYELVADIQSDGPGRSFYLGLPFQSGHAGVGIGGRDGSTNALLVDYAAWYREPHIAHQEQFFTTERHQVVATVRKNHLTVKVGEQTVFDWKGDPRRFIAWPDWATPGNLVTVGTHSFSFRIHSLKLTRLAPSESFPKPSPPRNGDLLAIVDLDRDTTQGKWTKTAQGVEGSPHNSNGLRLPAQLPANYEFRLVAERKSNSESLLVKFPVAGHPVQVDLGFSRGTKSGICWIEGKPADQNSTTLQHATPLFTDGQPTVIQGRVEGHHLKLEVSGNVLWDLDIPDSLIDPVWMLRAGWLTPEERRQMHVVTWETGYELQEVRFRPLDRKSPPFPALSVTSLTRPTSPGSPGSSGSPPSTGLPNPDQPLVGEGLLTTGTTPVPDAAAQQAATQKIREIFKDQFASSKKDAEKLGLAQKLEQLAEETRDDPAAKFVCLEQARKLAAEAGDLAKAFALVDVLVMEFKTDALELKSSTVKNVASKLKGPLLNKELVEKTLPLVDQLLLAEQFQTAVELVNIAALAAVKVKDKALQLEVQEVRKEAEDVAKEFSVANKARETLQTKSDDPAARMAWGRWLCFHQGNWPEGLKLLQGAGDEKLADLATRDLKSPIKHEEELQLGNDWLDYAASRKDHSLAGFGTRALYWLSNAHAESTGLTKTRVQALMETAVSVRDWNSPVVALLDSVGKRVGQQKFAMSSEVTMRGGGGVPEFRDFPPEGGILIGLNCHLADYDEGQIVRGLQPVFFTKTGQKLGAWHGPDTDRPVIIRARKGYAICDLSGMPGGETVFRSIQVSFAKISKSGLDPRRGYVSPVVGDQRNRDQWMRLGLQGSQPIIGIFGHADNYFRGLGVIFTK